MNTITKAAAVVAATGVIAGAAVAIAPTAANAASWHPGCATRADFAKVHRGQTVWRVQRELHQNGELSTSYNYDGYRYADRTFRACHNPRWSYLDVSFSANPGHRLRVSGKSAYWG